MDNKEEAVVYVKNTLRDYSEGKIEKGSTVQEMINSADYDIQDEVENVFAFLMPIPNMGTVYMSQQMNPFGFGEQLRLIESIDVINKKLDEY